MGKRIIAPLIAVLWASTAWGMLPGFNTVPVAGCSPTTIASNTADGATLYGNIQVFGQSFTLSEATNVYSIVVSGEATSGSTATLRIGTTSDLTSYLSELSTVSMNVDGETEFLFAAPLSLSAGVYYFGISKVSGTIDLLRNTADTYAGGTQYYTNAAGNWDMLQYGTRDIYFKVIGCVQ